MTIRLGVDIGGTGIKAAPVDVDQGVLATPRRYLATPQPATPGAVAAAVADVTSTIDAEGPVGFGYPGVVRHGVIATAANLDPSWIGTDAATLFSDSLGGRTVKVINDADAAGLAEVRFGAGAGQSGVVVMITLGTGIGTAVFVDGKLVPNTEFGHLTMDGADAERLASTRAKERDDLSWTQWAGHVLAFVKELERLMWPDLFIIGGGISADFQTFCEGLRTATPVAAATLGNDAGIVGAALVATL